MVSATVLREVAVLFLLMCAGYLAKKLGLIKSEGVRDITALIFNLISPCVIVVSFQIDFSAELARELVVAAAVGAGVHLASAAAAHFLFMKKPPGRAERESLQMGTVYSNAGAMGFPLLDAAIGKEGVFFGSIYFALYNLFAWTHGVAVYQGKNGGRRLKKILLNPNIIAIAVGILLFCFNVTLPPVLYDGMYDVYKLNMPLSMILIGAILADTDLKTIFSDRWIWPGIALRNLAIPVILATLLHFIGVSGDLLTACVLPAACPVAGITVLFCEQYGRQTGFAAKLMSVSTLLSVVTIPLVVVYVGFLG